MSNKTKYERPVQPVYTNGEAAEMERSLREQIDGWADFGAYAKPGWWSRVIKRIVTPAPKIALITSVVQNTTPEKTKEAWMHKKPPGIKEKVGVVKEKIINILLPPKLKQKKRP